MGNPQPNPKEFNILNSMDAVNRLNGNGKNHFLKI